MCEKLFSNIFADLNEIDSMIKITLPDGSIKEFAASSTPMDVAKNISEGFARNVMILYMY